MWRHRLLPPMLRKISTHPGNFACCGSVSPPAGWTELSATWGAVFSECRLVTALSFVFYSEPNQGRLNPNKTNHHSTRTGPRVCVYVCFLSKGLAYAQQIWSAYTCRVRSLYPRVGSLRSGSHSPRALCLGPGPLPGAAGPLAPSSGHNRETHDICPVSRSTPQRLVLI